LNFCKLDLLQELLKFAHSRIAHENV
jgi:hypothetical protein